jgi:hypothetical protein
MSFQHNIEDAAISWVNEQVDIAVSNNPRLSFIAKRLKDGLAKVISNNVGKVEMLEPFITDDNGEVNIKSISEELLNAFEQMPEYEYHFNGIDVAVGKGHVSIIFPDSFLANMFLDHHKLVYDKEDITEFINSLKM